MALDAGTAIVDITPGLGGFQAKLAAGLNAPLAGFKKNLEQGIDGAVAPLSQRIGSKMQSVGKGISIGLGVPIIAVGALALNSAQKVDDAFDTIRTGTGKTGAALAGLEADFKKIATRTPESLQASADAITQFSQRTGATGEVLQGLALKFIELQRITKTQLDIPTLTGAFTAFGVSLDDQPGKLDELFRVAQATGAPLDDIVSTLGRSGSIFRTFGLDLDNSARLLGILSKNGIPAQQAVAGLRKAFTQAVKAGKDPQQFLQATIDKIRDLARAGKDAAANKLAVQLFGPRGAALVEAAKNGSLALGDLKKAAGETTDTILGVAKDTKDFPEQFKEFRNTLDLALAPLGAKLFPALTKAAKILIPIVTKVADVFEALGPSGQQVVVIVGGILAALGPVVFIGGKVVSAAKSIATAFKGIGAAMKFAAANPWVLIIAGVILLAIVIVKNWKTIKKALGAAWNFIKDIGGKIVDFFKGLPGKVGRALKRFGPMILAVLFPPAALAVLIAKNWGKIVDWFKKLPGRVLGAIGGLAGKLLSAGKDMLVGLLKGIVDAFAGVALFFLELPRKVFAFFLNAQLWLFQAGIKILAGLLSGIVSGALAVWSWLTSLPGKILGLLVAAPSWLLDVGRKIIGGLWSGITGAVGAVWDFFTSIPGKLIGFFVNAGQWLWDIGSTIIGGLIGGLSSGLDALGNIVDIIKEKLLGIHGPSLGEIGVGAPLTNQRSATRAVFPDTPGLQLRAPRTADLASVAPAAGGAAGVPVGVTVNVAELHVRSDADVVKVGRELAKRIEQRQTGRGSALLVRR